MNRPANRTAILWSVVFLVLSPFLAGPGATLAGQDGPNRVQLRARALARAYDNFFRAPDGAEQETIFAWTGETRLALRLITWPLLEIYGEADYTRYETLGDSPGAGAGLQYWSRTHVVRLDTHYLRDRPVFELGEGTRFADLFRISGFYSFRPGSAWRFDLNGRTVRVRFAELPQADSRVYLVGGSVQYRALSSWFQPELGGRVGWRIAEDPDQDNTRSQISLGVASSPIDPLRMNIRYRVRSRWFTGDDTAARNFGRADDGAQWTVVSTLRASSHLHFQLFYNRMDMDSTLEPRIYSSQSVTLGATVLF